MEKYSKIEPPYHCFHKTAFSGKISTKLGHCVWLNISLQTKPQRNWVFVTFFSQPFIFATRWRRPLIFHIIYSVGSCLKYLKVYNIRLQNYRDLKIWVCGKKLIHLPNIIKFFGLLGSLPQDQYQTQPFSKIR